MTKRSNRSIPVRIDKALADWLKEIGNKNEISTTQASAELAKLKNRFENNNNRIVREIKI